jgi:hypothetical protein
MLSEDEDDGLFDEDDEEPRVGTPAYERGVAGYARLKESERILDGVWEKRVEALNALGGVIGSPIEERTPLWVAGLGDKVALLGGHLEFVAIFPEESVTLLREPGLHSTRSDQVDWFTGHHDDAPGDEVEDVAGDDKDDRLADRDDEGLDDEDGVELADDEDDGPADDEARIASCDEIGDETPADERRVAAYARLMDPEQILYKLWEQRGQPMNWIGEALGSIVEDDTPLWVTGLGEKVALLGGHLELVAVYESVTLLREPGPDACQDEPR